MTSTWTKIYNILETYSENSSLFAFAR